MKCGHCAFNCTMKGSHMSLKVFRKALKLTEYFGDSLTIGGGEPTLHPYFWTIIGETLGADIENGTWMATNGSQTEIALKLANMAKKGIMSIALSQDQWHDPIDKRVIEAFKRDKVNSYNSTNNNDYREIRTVNSLMNVGRARKIKNVIKNDDCACDDKFILPNGDIKQCGCVEAPILFNIMKNSFEEISEFFSNLNSDEGTCFQKGFVQS